MSDDSSGLYISVALEGSGYCHVYDSPISHVSYYYTSPRCYYAVVLFNKLYDDQSLFVPPRGTNVLPVASCELLLLSAVSAL